jgi:hypothetical protein
MNYDDNPIIQNLRKAYWSVDEDGMAIWDQWKRDSFLKMSPNERRQSLQIVDQYLDTQVRPTRDFAEMLTQKRELERLHLALHRAAR